MNRPHEATQPVLDRTIAEAIREKTSAEKEHNRLQKRWHEINGRKCLNEARKARFLARVDGELAAAHLKLTQAEANLEGLLLAQRGGDHP